MNETIIYRPHQIEKIPFFILTLGVFFWMILMGMSTSWEVWVYLFACEFFNMWLLKILYCASKQAVCFQQCGIQIIDVIGLSYEYITWEKLKYAYYIKNFRGCMFLILSPDVLNKKDVERLSKRITFRICINDKIVIPFSSQNHETSRFIKKIVENNVDSVQSF